MCPIVPSRPSLKPTSAAIFIFRGNPARPCDYIKGWLIVVLIYFLALAAVRWSFQLLLILLFLIVSKERKGGERRKESWMEAR